MPGYADLTVDQFIEYAETVPLRPQVLELHEYIESIRTLVDGRDQIAIPESHSHLLSGDSPGNHEGGLRLNRRIEQGAAWLSTAQIRFAIRASGPGEQVTRGASAQERFARAGEKAMWSKGALNKARQEMNRDLMECGFAVMQWHSNRDYYERAAVEPQRMKEGALFEELMYSRRIDPATFAWVPDDDGNTALIVISGERQLGELARRIGLAETQRLMGFYDFGTEVNPSDPKTWPHDQRVKIAEIVGSNNGALLMMNSANVRDSVNFGALSEGRILQRWTHKNGRPPYYVETFGAYPYHSPLDEMVQLTPARNYWATMLDVQASGAIFRHWQLVDTENEQDITATVVGETVPEHLVYDMSKPPPYMGPGKEWRPAPFEFHDVNPRYLSIKQDHEAAGDSVARLLGQVANQNTAVGTADFLDDAAMREFSQLIQSVEDQTARRWRDYFRYLRDQHKDPVWVHWQQRDSENAVGSFLSTAVQLAGGDIASEYIEARLDLRSRQAKLADFRYAMEAISAGFMDYRRAVDLGLIPDVDDAEAEMIAIAAFEAERLVAQMQLKALQMRIAQNKGLLPDQQGADPRFLEGAQTDPRSLGTGQGPDNISATALAPRADAIRAS